MTAPGTLTVLLCGDVMTGRGIDQILPHPADPRLQEKLVDDARTYVTLAEQVNGPIPRPVDVSWPWGEALPILDELAPDVRLINLETSITANGQFEQGKAVSFLPDLSNRVAATIADRIRELKRPGDVAVASLHWGSNWGYDIGQWQIRFAHRLIDGGVDIVYGHSSHHPRPIEIYRDKLILYGCGDAINDYEGIRGYEAYRDDLHLLYLASIEPDSGTVVFLRMLPMQTHRMRLRRASAADTEWLRSALERTSRDFELRIYREPEGTLALRLT